MKIMSVAEIVCNLNVLAADVSAKRVITCAPFSLTEVLEGHDRRPVCVETIALAASSSSKNDQYMHAIP